MTINTVENIRAWFLTCPTINRILSFNADYIGDKAEECSIYSAPTRLSYTEDVIGNITYNVRQSKSFLLVVRMPYSNDIRQNLDNIQFFDEVQEWMNTQNASKNFPIIADGTVVSIFTTKTQSISDTDISGAIYQMEISVAYDRNQ